MKLFNTTLASIFVAALVSSVAHGDQLDDSSFKIDFNDFTPGVDNENGRATVIAGASNPGLMGNGASVAEVSLAPGAVFQPHMHPRATEIFRVLKGAFRVCFIKDSGGGRFCNDLSMGNIQVFPMATIHYIQNTASVTSTYYSVLNSDSPGTFLFPSVLFQLPSEALSASFDASLRDINEIRQGIPANPAPQRANIAPNVAAALRRSDFD